jgi:hypothetical protein
MEPHTKDYFTPQRLGSVAALVRELAPISKKSVAAAQVLANMAFRYGNQNAA